MRLRWEDADESHTEGNPSTENNEGSEDATPLRSFGFLLFKTSEHETEDQKSHEQIHRLVQPSIASRLLRSLVRACCKSLFFSARRRCEPLLIELC